MIDLKTFVSKKEEIKGQSERSVQSTKSVTNK